MGRARTIACLVVVFGCKEAPPAPASADGGEAHDGAAAAPDAEARDGSGGSADASAMDAATRDASAADGGDNGLVPVFVAQGHVGRTTISCDDGRTWVGNRSDDDSIRCFSGVDCDHHPGAAHGVVFGHGWFFATFGWGQP